jgi:hypothetical protein
MQLPVGGGALKNDLENHFSERTSWRVGNYELVVWRSQQKL